MLLFSRIPIGLLRAGFPVGRLYLLDTPGRRTGALRTVPIAIFRYICRLCCRRGIASQRHAQGRQCIRAGAVPAERRAFFDLVRGPRFGHEIPAHVVNGEDLPESVLVDRIGVST
jgi:hypothetical protein